MFDRFYQNRKASLGFFIVLSLISLTLIPQIKVAFNFEQFFPTGDDDLEFFKSFIEEFEADDNFLLIAVEHHPSVFDTSFLQQISELAKDIKKEVPYVKFVQSLPDHKYAAMTPFGPTSIPALHIHDQDRLVQDSVKIMQDEQVLYSMINEKGTAAGIIVKTQNEVLMDESHEIMDALYGLFDRHGISDYHMVGRPYFQSALAKIQMREIILSTIVSGILISIVMILLFRKWVSIFIALGSITVGLIIFFGLLSIMGRELSLMSALYPVLMLIVGTSDVVHIMSKYHDELRKGQARREALRITIRQIGMATLLTSLTTAAGFATLLSSRILPIREFGINSAIGVLIAYIVVIGFTCPLMSFFTKEQMIPPARKKDRWRAILDWAYNFSISQRKWISWTSILLLFVFIYGITKVHTNYDLYTNLPQNVKISDDFLYFEKEFAGFRPLELAGTLQGDHSIYDYKVISEIAKAEDYLKSHEEIQTAFSLGSVTKGINQLLKNNAPGSYTMPAEADYRKIRRMLARLPSIGADVLISKDKRKTRVSSKVKDVGAQNIKAMSMKIDDWISQNIDPSVITFRQTGTGLLLDKNSEFVRESLTQGLLIALVIVSVLMGFLFRNWKMLFLALVPNIIPLLFAAALIGYTGIALEAGVSIVFAIIFGIAVDDTIHFLSKYKLAKDEYGGDVEKAMLVTFRECGKAIIFTTIILFFGFLVLLFSNNQPSVVIGMLISVTLLSALIADLTILPVLIRKLGV